jgi:hypothetical protein
MKTLLFNTAIILFVLSSCSTGKSFMHQRYTKLGHKNHVTVADKKESYAHVQKAAQPAAEPVVINTLPVASPTPVKQVETANVLTASANSGVTARKATASAGALKTTNFKPLKALENTGAAKTLTKQFKKENQSKHGLLFGVISALLSIIILVVVVAVIIFLVLILI